jgi:hypothetical protein
MNCQEVQAQLSDYLEKSLDPANLKSIETHLSTCLVCRTESDNLNECIRQVAALTIIDPPIGFTQRVMARVREMENRPSFWQRLFFPLQIKIPIQATAVVLIGIFAVYLFEKEQRYKPPLPDSFNKMTESPQTTTPKNQFSEAEQDKGASVSGAKRPAAPTKSDSLMDAHAHSSSLRKDTGALQAKTALGKIGETKAFSEERNEINSPSPLTSESRERAGGIILGTPVVNPGVGLGPFSAPSELGSSSLRPGVASIEPFADYDLVLRRFPLQQQDQSRRDSATARRKPDVGLAAGRQSVPQSLDRVLAAVPDTTQPQTVWITLPQSQYEQFKRDLRAVGTIESETHNPLLRSEPGEQTNGQLQIKLMVIPAAETNRSAPASPSDR